ncbi:MAG: restriction endonuclease subunit S [Eubacteriales bacterium]|nr:restriction endonuclease subunit S [Eubacteriales bacterium]
MRKFICYVPTLRFAEYTDEWHKFALSDFVTRITRRNKNNESSLPLTISAQYGLVDQITFFNKTVASVDLSGYYLLYNGDFAYNKSYSNDYAWGAVKRLDRYDKGCLSSLYFVFRPKDSVDSDYLTHYFETKKWHKGISDIAGEGARNHGLLNMAVDDYFATKHFLPAIDEQRKIAAFLNKIEKRIETQNKIIEDLKILKKELCRKMLSSITEQKTLGELCSITTGKLDANANNHNGLYPFFTCGKDTLSIDNYAFNGEAILIAGNGDIGHTKYYCGKFNAYQRTYVLMDFKADAQFIKMGIDTYLPQKISEETQGGAMPYIKLSTLTSLKIPFTTEENQLSIKNHFHTIAQKVENEIKLLELLLKQKSYFLNAMFI